MTRYATNLVYTAYRFDRCMVFEASSVCGMHHCSCSTWVNLAGFMYSCWEVAHL